MNSVERRLLRRLPRRVPVVLAVLGVVQAGLLARAIARVDAGPLPWLAVAGRAAVPEGWDTVVDRGRVVQRGRRGDLVAGSGPYRDLWDVERLTGAA